jgi:hypothetical protein
MSAGNTPTHERTKTMTLKEIYQQFTPGSLGFAKAVETHCGFNTTIDETKRIAERAKTAEEFEAIWQNEDWWTDANNDNTAE